MYKYLIADGQYLLTRNFKLLTSRYDKVEPQGIVTLLYQSVAKLRRDFVEYEIPLLIFDTAPYYKSSLIEDYKGSRYYYTEDDLVGVTDEKEIERITKEIELNNLKKQAKEMAFEALPKLGVTCIRYDGWEADDLAYTISKLVKCKAAVCSSDSDWSYLTSPEVDNIRFDGRVTTYSKMIENIPSELLEKVGGLQMYKGYLDSIYGSHNDLFDSRTLLGKELSANELIDKLSNNELKAHVDEKLFSAQLSTFRFSEYPSYNDVINYLTSIIDTIKYEKLDADNFYSIVRNYHLRIAYGYYETFIDSLNFSK